MSSSLNSSAYHPEQTHPLPVPSFHTGSLGSPAPCIGIYHTWISSHLGPMRLTYTPPSSSLCSEKKIDLIDDRLANIEELLRGLALRPGHDVNQPLDKSPRRSELSTAIPPLPHLGTPSCVPEDAESESSLDGVDSSIPASTIFASEFIEVATQRTSSHEKTPNPDISAALSSLRQIVTLYKRQSTLSDVYRFPRQKDISAGGLSQLPMPPLSVTIAEIEKMDGLLGPPTPIRLLYGTSHPRGLNSADGSLVDSQPP